MPKFSQVSFTSGEISPSLACRVDLQRFTSALAQCLNFFVRPQGGVSNRPGTEYVYTLSAESEAKLIPFIRAEDDAAMIVLQEETAKVFRNGAYINSSTTRTIIDIQVDSIGFLGTVAYVIETSVAHGYTVGDPIEIASVVHSFVLNEINGSWNIATIDSATSFSIYGAGFAVDETGSYTSGGTSIKALTLVTPYQSDELEAIRYTQSADVLTLVHQLHYPSEIVRTSATVYAFAAIADIEHGPFLEINTTATTITASAATGTGITLTASASIFTAAHIGSLMIIYITDLSTTPPWQANVSATAGNFWESNGKVYEALNTANTGTIAPTHEEGDKSDGGVTWRYFHSMYGIALITAQAGTTATADVLIGLPFVSPTTSVDWAFGAWSEDQGYPGCVTYYGDRLVFARSIEKPQTQWASKVGDYHDFGFSVPSVASDSITQTLNSRQTNAIVDLVPLEQLVSLTANSSWASPARGESWSPETVGFFPQNNRGAADMSVVIAGEGAIVAEKGARKLRELMYAQDRDKFGGNELTVLARHLFEDATIQDMAYADDPDGILWIVRTDGALIGLTYLPEQEVVAFHRHDTNGYFERVCVIPEDGRDAVYFVVRRTVGGETVRLLERLAARSNDSLDAMYVDSALSYDGRNTTATTITVSGASYDGGATVTLTASASLFASTDIGDAIQFDLVHVLITGYTSATVVTGELQSPLGEELQAVATDEWAFARDTFSGLAHLEGEVITGLFDGNHIAPGDTTTEGVVTGGQIVLTYPAAVVHIGLEYTPQIKTLTLNVPGGAQIRDNAKIVPKVSIVVESTAGLAVGPDEDNLEDLSTRWGEAYTEPNALHTGVITGYVLTTWDKESSIIVRQPYPKPATILAILPHLAIGGGG